MPSDPADDLRPADGFQPPQHFCLVAAIFEGALVVVAVGVGWLVGSDPMATFPRMATELRAGMAWGLLAAVPPLAVSLACLRVPWRPFRELLRVVDDMLIPLFRGCRVSELAILSALAGLGEEMLFRGVIQSGVARSLGGSWGTWVGLAAATLLFGVAHRITITYALLAGAIGLYLGGVWLWTENLLVPITAHAMYDFCVLVYLIRRSKPAEASP